MSQDLPVRRGPHVAAFNGAGNGHDAKALPAEVLSAPRPFPVPFGEPGRIVSAFFYPPRPQRQRDAVVVLCSAIGWEAIAARQTYRSLTAQLTEEGFAVLSFDYLGAGDSSGSDTDSGRVAAWLESLQEAIAAARRLSGQRRVSLVGLHLGASLAMRGAIDAGGVESLVLWAPYSKGRAFVREARAYRALNGDGDKRFPRAEDRGDLEAAGFLFTAATMQEISALDLTAVATSPAPDTLVLGRDSNGSELPLVTHLRKLGSRVTHSVATGYADMMQEPRKSVVPLNDCAQIVSFLTHAHAAVAAEQQRSQPSQLDPSPQRLVETGGEVEPGVVEHTFALDPDRRLFGVLAETSHGSEPQATTALIILNTAAHPRVGPNRMYVPIARAIARLGVPALRFDLTGLGDSAGSPEADGQLYSKVFIKDVVTAMNALEARGFTRFVLFGLCSGAYLAFHSALADARVASTVMINPQTFDWKDGDSLEIGRRISVMSTSFYRRALANLETWRRALRGDIDFRTISHAFMERAKHRAQLEIRRSLTKAGVINASSWFDVGASFEQLLDRGTTTYLVYSAHDEGIDHLTSQVGGRLRRLRKHEGFRMDLVEGPDHTFSQLWAQGRLQELLVRYIEQTIPSVRARSSVKEGRGPVSRRGGKGPISAR